VPAELGFLSDLEKLELQGNGLSGSLDALFCEVGSLPIDKLRADCSGSPPEIACSCCTKCCDAAGRNCTTKDSTLYTSERFQMLLDLIGPTVTSSPELWEDPKTPQYAALEWLADLDEWNTDIDIYSPPLQVWVERYVLALLYHSTNGNSWSTEINFMQNTSVCEWSNLDLDEGVICDDPYVTELNLRKLLTIELDSTVILSFLPQESNIFSFWCKIRRGREDPRQYSFRAGFAFERNEDGFRRKLLCWFYSDGNFLHDKLGNSLVRK
jgi:hypothetical protein